MNKQNKYINWIWQYGLYILSCIFLFLIFLFPVILYNIQGGDGTVVGLVATVIYLLPLFLLCLLPKHKWITICLFTLLFAGTLAETCMLLVMKGFLTSGAILATFMSNADEAGGVVKNGLFVLKIVVPLFLLYITAVVMYAKSTPLKKVPIYCGFAVTLLLAGGFYWKRTHTIADKPLWHHNTVFTRPPYNFYVNLYRASVQMYQRRQIPKYIAQLSDFKFGAYRSDTIDQRETYVFVIGESMRYENLSLNGSYQRSTTPMLEATDRLVSFSDYYSTACLTMYAVPLLITRAEPDNFDLHYKEPSIVAPFKECGFTTCAVIRRTKFLLEESFLLGAIDSIIVMEQDDELVDIVDSLSNKFEKLFVISQLWGSHHPYDNYPPQFERYTPSSNTDPMKYTDERYYMNAYDNSILYTDSILATLMQRLDKKDIVSSVVYVSDHGESVSNEKYGHGFDLPTQPHDKYKCQFHIPFVVWYSNKYEQYKTEKVHNLLTHCDFPINANMLYYSLCDMADIVLPPLYGKLHYSVFEDSLSTIARTILLTDGEYVMPVDE